MKTEYKKFAIEFNDKNKIVIVTSTDSTITTAFSTNNERYENAKRSFTVTHEAGGIADDTTFYEILKMLNMTGIGMYVASHMNYYLAPQAKLPVAKKMYVTKR